MKSSVLSRNQHAQNTHAPLDRRDAERAPIHYRAKYTGGEGARLVTTEGSLRDLSKTGCKILGTRLPAVGNLLTISLDLEDGHSPLRLTDATVSWITGSIFAVKFPKLSDDQRKRIQAVILKHVTYSPSMNHRTAFRIAL